MQQISFDRSNSGQTALVALATVAALALLGFVTAYWTWGWLAPRPEARAPGAADMGGGASAGALFGNLQRDRTGAVPVGIAIRLLGIVAAAGGRSGYAVVQLEPRQILAVREGEDVAPGVRIAEVGIDHVILERGGIRETLTWPEKSSSREPPPMRVNQ